MQTLLKIDIQYTFANNFKQIPAARQIDTLLVANIKNISTIQDIHDRT